MGNYMTLKPPNLGKNLNVDTPMAAAQRSPRPDGDRSDPAEYCTTALIFGQSLSRLLTAIHPRVQDHYANSHWGS
jgi:hypothetical protein